jgi:P pilus assembly chaperone PapD
VALPRQSRSVTVQVTNLTSRPLTLPVSVEDSTGEGSFTATPSRLSLPAQGTSSVSVTFTAPKQGAKGSTQAVLHLGDAAHAALFAYLK